MPTKGSSWVKKGVPFQLEVGYPNRRPHRYPWDTQKPSAAWWSKTDVFYSRKVSSGTIFRSGRRKVVSGSKKVSHAHSRSDTQTGVPKKPSAPWCSQTDVFTHEKWSSGTIFRSGREKVASGSKNLSHANPRSDTQTGVQVSTGARVSIHRRPGIHRHPGIHRQGANPVQSSRLGIQRRPGIHRHPGIHRQGANPVQCVVWVSDAGRVSTGIRVSTGRARRSKASFGYPTPAGTIQRSK